MPVQVDTRLRETHLGDWQGLTHLDVDSQRQAPGSRGATTPVGHLTAERAGSTSPRAACRW